jgi:hypothetical protein
MRKVMLATSLYTTFLFSTTYGATVFDFEPIDLGTPVPFVHAGEISATFNSSDESVFSIVPSFFFTLTGNTLADVDPLPHPLDIVFSSPVTSISLVFALNDPSSSGTLTLMAYSGGTGGTVIGSASTGASIPPGAFFAEGSIAFSMVGVAFDAVSISSTAPDLAIDNITVTPVPEPEMMGLILIAIGIFALRRRFALMLIQAIETTNHAQCVGPDQTLIQMNDSAQLN